MGLNARTHFYARIMFDRDHDDLSEPALERAWHQSSAEDRQVYLDRATAKIKAEQRE